MLQGILTALLWTGLVTGKPSPWIEYMEARARDVQLVHNRDASSTLAVPPLEVSPLILSGDPNNRIDFVFFADGYLSSEKAKFINDALTFAKDITTNHTFSSVQPLMNFWAAFTPSRESGVGRGGVPKDTVFHLYRDGTELRGVWSTDYDLGRQACATLGTQCDYPILLGNDPLYGGSGGIPTIITASPFNGHQILRHELGHSILGVGEEYDGIELSGYNGINSGKSRTNSNATTPNPIPWAHWLTNPAQEPRVQRNNMPLQQYAWALLNMTQPWRATFSSSGTFSRYLVRVSLSGFPSASDLTMKVDGVDQKWAPIPGLGMDRYFYDLYKDIPLSKGTHDITFTLNNASLVGDAQMCSVEILEFGSASEFNATEGFVGLFPTYSTEGLTEYRPTNEGCLMRQVTTQTYCQICLEGMWTTLLGRLNLIDNITESCTSSSASLTASLIPVANLRNTTASGQHPGEAYSIQWLKDGQAVPQFENKTTLLNAVRGSNYTVSVKFTTPEIRLDKNRVTERKASHVVKC